MGALDDAQRRVRQARARSRGRSPAGRRCRRSPHQSVTGARTSPRSKPHGRPRYASSRASQRPPLRNDSTRPRAYASSLAGSPVGGGARPPTTRARRAATRGETRASRIALCTSRGSAPTPSGGGIDPTSATRVTRSGATAATASACGPPADQPMTANRSTGERREHVLRPASAAIRLRTAGPERSSASSRTPSAAAIASSGWRESRESPPPWR